MCAHAGPRAARLRAGWAVILKSCVSRSIVARTGSGVPSTSTVVVPRRGAAIGCDGNSNASQPSNASSTARRNTVRR